MPTAHIHNCTSLPLHISLKQLTPLYYENYVQPGGSMTRYPGQVWFTIEARLADPEQPKREYDDWDNILPIAMYSVGGILAAGGLLVGAGVAGVAGAALAEGGALLEWALANAAWLATAARAGAIAVQVGSCIGVGTGAAEGMKALMEEDVVNVKGWYMSGERNFYISGGPQAVVKDGKTYIDLEKPYPPFTVDDKPPSS
ncbi:hypothetical protein PHLGIDRAFT_12245 [Phlebiopsis gigantea 11061_1 CR5-6]|uniref:Uncharacterized protein n=1 Tax=Phlebiopsis gigantea (strain 11061_1 CR5-6) TaxID=745531 RepID=A0A0C3S1M2_PHLG1|nr:hypothetical protein PHLGIDRAFT_12245 [Phlebiopsis gigantea 11061_1 CR5-6]